MSLSVSVLILLFCGIRVVCSSGRYSEQATGWITWSFNPDLDKRTNRRWAPTLWVPRVPFRGVSSNTSVDIKIEWSRTYTPPVYFHDVYRINYTFSWGVKILWIDFVMICVIGQTTRWHIIPTLGEFSWNFEIGTCAVQVKEKHLKAGKKSDTLHEGVNTFCYS